MPHWRVLQVIFKLAIEVGFTIVIVAFICEYVDSTLGMGYGTILTPVLLMLGYTPLQVVPAVLLSELITGMLAAFGHHKIGNVNLKPRTTEMGQIIGKLRALGYINTFKQEIPLHLKTAIVLAVCSIAGTLLAVFLAVSIPPFWLKLYIGILVLAIGVVILCTLKRKYIFSWKKIIALGTIASFNKGMSGGGYGPVVTGGQILSGVETKSAIGITSLAEGCTCLVGVISYSILTKSVLDWELAPYLLIGAVLSVPLSIFTVKRIKTEILSTIIGIIITLLGITTLIKIFI
jgi:uncharacterized membrane protein YfcA